MNPIKLTPVVKAVMIACGIAFLVQQTADHFFGGNLMSWFGLVPSGFVVQHRFWQLVTYPFLHGDVMHLFLNLVMWAFTGSELEAVWGRNRFARFCLFCAVVAGAAYLLLQLVFWSEGGAQAPMAGLSGVIYGVLMAYGLIFSERVLLFFMLFPMKAKHFVWVLAAMEFLTTVYSTRGKLAAVAHLGGMMAGLAYLFLGVKGGLLARVREAWQARALRVGKKGAQERRAQAHLKLVINNALGEKAGPAAKSDDRGDPPKTWH